MIELDLFFTLLVLVGVAALGAYLMTRRREVLSARVPPGLVASTTAEVRQARDYYRLCRRMAHILEGIQIHDGNFPILNDRLRSEIDEVMKEWEKL